MEGDETDCCAVAPARCAHSSFLIDEDERREDWGRNPGARKWICPSDSQQIPVGRNQHLANGGANTTIGPGIETVIGPRRDVEYATPHAPMVTSVTSWSYHWPVARR